MKIISRLASVLVLLFLTSGEAQAGDCGYQYCWGAVGFGPNGAYGWAHSQWSEDDAYNAVQQACGWNCTEVQTFYNACGAMAVGNNGGWGWAVDNTRASAESAAVGYCRQYDSGCRPVVWACSP